jgi:hypothetical protein
VAQHDLAGIARRAYRNIDGWSGHRGSVVGVRGPAARDAKPVGTVAGGRRG